MKTKTVFAAFLAAASLDAAVIQQVIVRQQWPWSTDVKVEYRLAQVTAPVNISVKAFNGDTELDNSRLAESITGDIYGVTEPVGHFIIDPVRAFGDKKVAIADFRVELEVTEAPANIGETVYRIFCLTNGTSEAVTRADLLNGKYGPVETSFSAIGEGFTTSLGEDVIIWTGVTNNVDYRTTHLVMRKIPAKGATFMMGSPEGEIGRERNTSDAGTETQVKVRFTEDYYVSVFELTQAQYRHVTGAAPVCNYTGEDADLHPVEKISHNTLRGSTSTTGPSGEKINWPTNSNPHEVASSSFLARLRAATGNAREFDLPTSAQWEFACRAGTDTAINNGKNLANVTVYPSANLESVAWFNNNQDGSTGNLSTHVVGTKAPNAWGLYDMHGNVGELCLGGYVVNVNPDGAEELADPPGFIIVPNGNCTWRGGNYRAAKWYARSAARSHEQMQIWTGNTSMAVGVRLAFQAGDAE